MSHHNLVQFVTLIVYAVLFVIVLRSRRVKLKKLFTVYLIASTLWSFTSFMANYDLPSEQVLFWSKLVALVASWSIVSYSHFIAAFVHKGTRLVARLGYGYLFIIAALTGMGYIHKGFIPLSSGIIQKEYGSWLYIMIFGGAIFMGVAVFLLVKSYLSSTSPDHRNRVTYLLAGISLLVSLGIIWEIFPRQSYSIDHLGHLGNALLITYAILRYQLLDMKLVVRKGLVYSGITGFITAAFLLLLYGLNFLLRTWEPSAGLAITIGMVCVAALFLNPLKVALEKGAARLFYGKTYDYRQMVLTFASRMSNVIDLDELAEAMLVPITNAVSASQASLLFASDGSFTSQFAERLSRGEPVIPINLRRDGAIVSWLAREDRPLTRETIEVEPEFDGLWQEERNNIEAAQVELLCPIKSKQRLVAILALSKKSPRGFYSRDDIDMLMTLSHEAAVAIENAELYAKAKQRANTDELTGLFNHRYFHQRLDEEIARASRFGEVFSLIFLDLDLFKTYNDIRGHLAGDEILKQLGQHMRKSIRDVDIGFRYGGDEFAIVLPETSLDDARKVAERIRKGIESLMDWQGIQMTCSIGIASWPTDGVMREEIIQAADAALYYAKQTGRNRTCLACEVALSEVLRMESGSNSKGSGTILSTIYALAATVDAKDHYTYGHSKKVSKYATDIAEALGYSREGIARIRAAALLHDIGKIGISDQLLKKSGPLTVEEWEPIHAHPNLGVAIIKHVDSLKDCLAAVQYHHEHHDGSGYPSGLKGKNIPLDARILSVADAYDAMTSQRPHRKKRLTFEQALEELKRCAGTQFDPEIIEVFVRLNQSSAAAKSKGNVAKSTP